MELLGKTLDSHECGFFDIRLVKDSEGISPESLKRLQLFLIGVMIACTLALFRRS
jgi:hypothetical protein